MVPSRLIRFAFAVVAVNAALLAAGVRAQALDPDVERGVGQDRTKARLERLSDSDLKSFYLDCSRAGRRSLGMGGVAVCSVGYELLLQRTFGGDFYALLAWSRRQQVDGAETQRRLKDCEQSDRESPRGI
jgi:hypothetical protein